MIIINWLFAIIIAVMAGKMVSKIRLPSLLGWLITGMILGPYGLNVMSSDLLNAHWYKVIIKIFECCVGFMIGSELVWKKLKDEGKAIFITTLTQSLGTYVFVSTTFALIFSILNIPIYLAFIFGGIALATAPAPALSIVKEFRAKGPVTETLIPMAAIDDMIGVICFFTTISIVMMNLSTTEIPIYIIALMTILPLLIGIIPGLLSGKLLKKQRFNFEIKCILIFSVLLTTVIGFYLNSLMPAPVLNFMLMGMSFSAVLANYLAENEEQFKKIKYNFQPILSIALLIAIMNLGIPLDYKAIGGTGLFTFIYIGSRAIGKCMGSRIGAKMSGLPETVQKYLGFTLLPHSGVSLVFAGIAVTVISKFDSIYVPIIQGTIAAAAIINELIAVVMAKKGFEWAGEIKKDYIKN